MAGRATRIRALCVLPLLAPWSLAGGAAPPSRPPDQILLGAQILDAAGATGGVLAVDWTHPLSPGVTLLAGASGATLAEARWAFGRIGGAWRVGRRTGLDGEVDLGRGSDAGADFGYRVARASLTRTLIPGRLEGFLQDRYLEIGTAKGNLIKVGLAFPTGAIGSARVAYEWTSSGNLGSTSASASFDLRAGRIGVLAGAVVGESIPSASPLLPPLPSAATNEVFAGARVPLGSRELTLLLDTLEVGATRRNSLVVGLRLPL
jgi:hypothetical protein